MSYDKTNLIVTDISGTIENTDKEHDWIPTLDAAAGSGNTIYYEPRIVWSQNLHPLEAVTLENYSINRDYDMGPHDHYDLYITLS